MRDGSLTQLRRHEKTERKKSGGGEGEISPDRKKTVRDRAKGAKKGEKGTVTLETAAETALKQSATARHPRTDAAAKERSTLITRWRSREDREEVSQIQPTLAIHPPRKIFSNFLMFLERGNKMNCLLSKRKTIKD